MSNRKLVTLRTIKELKPIIDADNIELARIDGWQCVVKKGEFEVGDLGLYFEVDSLLPQDDRWAFLEKYKWRVKTIRLRGVVSQGLLLPLDILTESEKEGLVEFAKDTLNGSIIDLAKERIDLSDLFGVEKYEHPDKYNDSNDTRGGFPAFLHKTDQERIQNLVDEYETDFKFHPYEITEKLEGTSITIYYNSFIDEFGVCSRNVQKSRSNHPIWNIVDEMEYEERLREYGKPIALQGELIGEGIQSNVYGLDGHEFRIFDVWDIQKHEYIIPMKRFVILLDLFGDGKIVEKNHVPILAYNSIGKTDTVDDLLELAEGKSEIKNDIEREGLVFKSMGNPDISFKVINNNYLLGK